MSLSLGSRCHRARSLQLHVLVQATLLLRWATALMCAGDKDEKGKGKGGGGKGGKAADAKKILSVKGRQLWVIVS